jgi:FRG domain
MITSQGVDSLSSFLCDVSSLSEKWKASWVEKQAKDDGLATAWLPWFRGEESAEWLSSTALQPKLYRNGVDTKIVLDHEQEMRVEFRRRSAQLITERQPAGKWEWYFLMQHYKAPTRLLDWSDAALVGLYFAISQRGGKNDTYTDDAAVYMLDPWWLNEQAVKEVTHEAEKYQSVGPALPDWDEAKPYLPDEFDSERLGLKCPLAIDPSHFSRRIAAQRSRFTIFGREKDGLKAMANGSDESRLVKFGVQKTAIPTIKRDLRLAGISEDTIFPDLEGLGRELSYWFDDNYMCVPLSEPGA